jgi:NDP-sugar pyrophosphorylase family protein
VGEVVPPFVVMAGGEGARMRAHDGGTSKLLAPVEGVPLLEQLLLLLEEAGIREIYVVTRFRHEHVADFVARYTKRRRSEADSPAELTVARQTRTRGTQDALQELASVLENREFVVIDGATLVSSAYLARFAESDVRPVAVGVSARISSAWHHALAAVTRDDTVRAWWLETEPPVSLDDGERYGRNMGILKVDSRWIDLTAPSTAHALRDAISVRSFWPVAAVWDDGTYRHFNTPREYGFAEPDAHMKR